MAASGMTVCRRRYNDWATDRDCRFKRIEEVYFPHDPMPYYIDRNSEALKVLHIRDEAHRFGITFHRQKRSLAFIKSELEQTPSLAAVQSKNYCSVSGRFPVSATMDELTRV